MTQKSHCMKRILGELVRRALIQLSIEHREVIDLVYYHEKSVDEVAHILDIPPATVIKKPSNEERFAKTHGRKS
jgi:DNA-directed RNA polymerase specialized sigma24 family protein